jgi:hypothetical protein
LNIGEQNHGLPKNPQLKNLTVRRLESHLTDAFKTTVCLLGADKLRLSLLGDVQNKWVIVSCIVLLTNASFFVCPIDTGEELFTTAARNESHELWKMLTEPIQDVLFFLGIQHFD